MWLNKKLSKACSVCPWPQPGTDRHGITFYKIHVTTLGPFQHKQALPFRESPDTLSHILFPLGVSGKQSPLGKGAYPEIWKPDREGQRVAKVIGVNHPKG